MDNPLKSMMSTMGTGVESSDPLPYEEAYEAMKALLAGNYHPVTFGAFMVAERWKSETVEELAGFLDAIVETDRRVIDDGSFEHIDVAGKFDGKVRGVNTDFAGSLLASAAGVPVFTHTGRNVPTKPDGVTFLDILAELEFDTEPDPEQSRKSLREIGFSYSNCSVYAPALDGLKEDRRNLGVRCFLNTIESLIMPTNAPVHLGAFYHLPFAKRVCDVFETSRSLSPQRVIMITGMEGQTELRPGYTAIAEWRDGEFRNFEVKTGEIGIEFDRGSLEAHSGDAKSNARLLTNWIQDGDVPEAYRESVTLNAACRLYAGGGVDTLEKGIDRARETAASATVRSLWEQLVERFRR